MNREGFARYFLSTLSKFKLILPLSFIVCIFEDLEAMENGVFAGPRTFPMKTGNKLSKFQNFGGRKDDLIRQITIQHALVCLKTHF